MRAGGSREALRPRSASGGAAARLAGGYMLAASLLLVALALVTLPVEMEDDRWVRIGSVMVAVGIAVWLPLRWMLPAVFLLWLAPLLARELLGEGRAIGWVEAAELAGFVFVAVAAHVLYALAAGRLSQQSSTNADLEPGGVESAAPAESTARTPAGTPWPGEASSPGYQVTGYTWPHLGISRGEASRLIQRLKSLDDEVSRTGETLRLARGALGR